MARFARDCLHAMDIVTANLEAILGPDTADLSMRFGIHSGPGMCGYAELGRIDDVFTMFLIQSFLLPLESQSPRECFGKRS